MSKYINDQQKENQENPSRKDIWQMFDRISTRYDYLNRLLSLRRDVAWRKRLIKFLPANKKQKILDLACGTADVLLTIAQQRIYSDQLVGIDLAKKMLKVGRQKVYSLKLYNKVTLIPADALSTPFKKESFDAITIAFGIRNLISLEMAFQEILRLLKPGGRLLILEFSIPQNVIFKYVYLFYFRNILTGIGSIISGDSEAYSYLNKTVESFPYGTKFCKILEKNGFIDVNFTPLTFGIASIYSADKF